MRDNAVFATRVLYTETGTLWRSDPGATLNCINLKTDYAPIEWIVNDMVIRFILEGGTEYLQYCLEILRSISPNSLLYGVTVGVRDTSGPRTNNTELVSSIPCLISANQFDAAGIRDKDTIHVILLALR